MTTTELPGRVDLTEHGIDATGARLSKPDDRTALHARARARRRQARRRRPARRRHRPLHRPLAQGQVPRRRDRLHAIASGGATSTRSSPRITSSGLREKVTSHLAAAEALYVVDAWAGADRAHRIGVRVITAHPYHALFAKTMFIDLRARRARGLRAAGARPAHARPRGGSRGGRHAHRHVHRPASGPHRAARRRHVLRGRDQEVDLHGDERPAAARGRLPDALLGERRRRRSCRDLLRPVGHGQDDALGRPRARADRRRRAWLGRQRRLQHRGRLLREGDPPVAGCRARDLSHDAHVRDDPRERRGRRDRASRSRRRLEDREHARRLQARADRQRAPRSRPGTRRR